MCTYILNDLYAILESVGNARECRSRSFLYNRKLKQDAQLSQRDRAAGNISFGRKWKTGTHRQYFTDIVSLASTTVT